MTTSEKPKPPRKKPQRNVKPAPPREKATLHPRNRHQGHYDFPKLIKSSP
ncbi:RlmF-related methyltransferase, partial [Pseudomonas viridiflava]